MFKTVVDALGRTFLISSLAPAALFTLLNQAVVLPVFTSRFVSVRAMVEQLLTLGSNWVLFLSTTLFVALFLTSASPTIIKLFEGVFPFQKKLLWWRLKYHRARFDRVYSREAARQLVCLQRDYPRITDPTERRSFEAEIRRREEELLREKDALDVLLWYPHKKENLLPTRLGNILRASEDYGRTHYGLDSILIWPRLLDLIPPEYREALDDARSSLEFLLNCSLLTWIFALECGLVLALNQQWGDLIWTVILFAAGYGMYSAAIPVAQVYADLVRSTIDRFRLPLLQAMGVSLPIPLEHERYLWQRFNRFLLFGNPFDYPTSFIVAGDTKPDRSRYSSESTEVENVQQAETTPPTETD
ncbi:MAG: hypothetical protein N2508_10440 [Anaerolineae bacterium]|nr:hypothetical protein [Anaerolineae bacterium]